MTIPDLDRIKELALKANTVGGDWWLEPRTLCSPTVRCWVDEHKTRSKTLLKIGHGNHYNGPQYEWEKSVARYVSAVRPDVMIEIIKLLYPLNQSPTKGEQA